ncbi:MAG: hypothetical protein ACERKD_24260 [Prolixibacteraceae bacterium]
MPDKEFIIKQVKDNIQKFNPFDFCSGGGWPNYKTLDVIIKRMEENEEGTTVDVCILYVCDHANACFVENSNMDTLDKVLFFGRDGSFKIVE